MVQTRASGRKAHRWGHVTARRIVAKIGAKMLNPGESNEAIFRGKRVVIKCLKLKTQKIGVTLKMLRRLDSVIAAKQLRDRSFELRTLPASVFNKSKRFSRSKSHRLQPVVQVPWSAFKIQGEFLRNVRL